MNSVTNASPLLKALQATLDTNENLQTPASQAAFAEFLRLGLPTQRLDAWKYTDLRRLAAREFKLAQGPSASSDASVPLDFSFAQRIVFVDGMFDVALSSQNETAGIVVRRSTKTRTTQPANIERRSQQTAFELLNTALSIGHVNIDIAPAVSLKQPVYLAFIWSGKASGLMAHPRISVHVGKHAKAELIEHHLSLSESANFSNARLDVTVDEHAELTHVRLQEDSATNFLIQKLDADVAGSARYLSHHYALGAGLSRCDIDIRLNGAEAHCELHGLLLAKGSEHVDVRTCIDHCVAHTRSVEDYRGIADGRGRVVFNGKVIVRPQAQKTDARQSSRNLLLSPTAEIDTRPELEIYANDVQCAHGATVGQLDAGAIFYLRSRGLSHDDARSVLTHAFAAELLERLPNIPLRAYILNRLMQRLGVLASSL